MGLSSRRVRPPTQDAAIPSLLPLGTTISWMSHGETLDDAGWLRPLLIIPPSEGMGAGGHSEDIGGPKGPTMSTPLLACLGSLSH